MKEKESYKDIYGCTASIVQTKNGYRLKVFAGCRYIINKVYDTYRGAKIAMGRTGDAGDWRRV